MITIGEPKIAEALTNDRYFGQESHRSVLIVVSDQARAIVSTKTSSAPASFSA